MVSKKGVKKPRASEYGKPHAVRFKKEIDKKLAVYCLENPNKRPSSIIQDAVECFLMNPNCKAKRRL
jgi:hypothetical protein